MMRHIAWLLSLAVCFAGCGQTPEEKAVDAILKLGGKVERDEKLPDRPVAGIDLRGTKATDVGLKELQELKGLRILDLRDTQITDAGLKELKELKGLQTLDLRSTQITDVGLNELQGLNGLQTLDLTGTKITDAALKGLKQALPTTDIRIRGP